MTFQVVSGLGFMQKNEIYVKIFILVHING